MAQDPVSHSAAEPSNNGYRYDSVPVHNRPSSTSPPSVAKPSSRLLAPDLLRGLLMAIMALDHVALGLLTWEHGTNRDGEVDGIVVRRWNFATAYVVRTLTHLCAPGFTLLLGMGVVFLSRSRTRLGWSAWRLSRYYAMRAFVLTVVMVLLGFVTSGGRWWFMNIVLFALAVDYLLAGMLWLLMDQTERMLARVLTRALLAADGRASIIRHDNEDDEDEGVSRPLLHGQRHTARESERTLLASSISWHIHNAILVVLSIVTIFWNTWLSENHGHCKVETTTTAPHNPFLRIWFWPVNTENVISAFPPMAWLSFAILGLLYGRILAARKRTSSAMAVGHVFAGALFLAFFVLTRVLRFGNLSEDCLHTPDQDESPLGNPYLASPASFLYVVKYPPDVAFWAFSMAGNLFLLAIFSAIPARIAKRFTMLLDFGTSSLFFYVVHLLIALSFVNVLLREWFGSDVDVPDTMKPGSTKGVTNLFGYFASWVCLLLILWPACRYYSRFKSTRHSDSLWRFF